MEFRIDDTVFDRIRHVAVDACMSVSAWVHSVICREIESRDIFEQDREAARLFLKEGLSQGGELLKREQAHER